MEVLDFCGPFEVFSVARRPGENGDEGRLFNVRTIAEARRTVRCVGGLLVEPHLAIGDGDAETHFDILMVPGGQGTRRERLNGPLLDWIAAQDRRTELTTSVCTGAFLLAERGILDGKSATTHWASVRCPSTPTCRAGPGARGATRRAGAGWRAPTPRAGSAR